MAELGRRFTGKVALGALKRLRPLLESAEGNVDVELTFGIDESGIRYLRGRLAALLTLTCQRCLGPLEYPIENEFQLALVQSDSEVSSLPEQYEPLLVETTPLHMLDMLEDEILLSIPHIPSHSEEACTIRTYVDAGGEAEQQNEARDNPFAVLEKLKKDH